MDDTRILIKLRKRLLLIIQIQETNMIQRKTQETAYLKTRHEKRCLLTSIGDTTIMMILVSLNLWYVLGWATPLSEWMRILILISSSLLSLFLLCLLRGHFTVSQMLNFLKTIR